MMKFYDSMRTGDVPSNTKESIATLLKYFTQLIRYVYLVYPDVQQQTEDPFVDFLHWHLHIPFVKAMTLQE